MKQPFEDFYKLLEELHENIKDQIAGLAQDELDWSPGQGINSIAVLAVHIAGSERFWIGDTIMREPSGRDREAEFVTSGKSEQALVDLLDASLGYIEGAFGKLDVDVLEEMRISPRDGREISVARTIAHVIEHTALHLGHIQITKQLLALEET
jgi:uncharacterized damage-inducible protein DinB